MYFRISYKIINVLLYILPLIFPIPYIEMDLRITKWGGLDIKYINPYRHKLISI